MKFSSSLNDVTGVQSQAQSKKLYAARESRGTTINRCLHNSVSCMGRLSLRDCKASFLRATPSALVPWDFLRLSWKPVTPGDDSSPCSLLVGSKDTGESGQSNSGPFWLASTLLFISRLPSSFGTSLVLLLVAGKESFTELHFKPPHSSS